MTDNEAKAHAAYVELGRALNEALPVQVRAEQAVALRDAIDSLISARVAAAMSNAYQRANGILRESAGRVITRVLDDGISTKDGCA